MKHPLVPSHRSNLLGAFYLTAGTQPHPTAILFHGFPGYEQNPDLAQRLRRAGWNALSLHYRGSWGVAGQFSFLYCIEDADAEIAFVLDSKNAAQYRIHPNQVVVIGHTMRRLMAVSAAAHSPGVTVAVRLSSWIGTARPNEAEEAKPLSFGENHAPTAGAEGATLAHEEFTHRARLVLVRLAPAITPTPVLIVTASNHSDQFALLFAAVLDCAGFRLELAPAVLAFLKSGSIKKRTNDEA